DDDVVEVVGGEEVRRLEAEEDDDEDQPEDDREDPEVARLEVVQSPAVEAGHSGGRLFCGRRGLVLPDDLDPGGTHTDAPAAVAAMPETFVGAPAVIAWTTSSGVVFSRSYRPTFRPRRRTVMRVAVSKTSCRLWEMITTARPCSARRRTSASTCSVWATPSAAVGSSRMTSLEFHCTAFATATDCRCPPESVA